MAEMTGLERVRCALRLEEADKVPVFPLSHYASTRAVDMKINDFATNADSMAEALIGACNKFGYDGVCPGVDVVIEAEACGSQTVQPEDAPAFTVKPVIQDYSDLGALDLPNPLKDGRMPVVVKATEICKKEIGRDIYISSWIMGPMNIASQLRGVETVMFDIVDNPKFFEELLDYSTEVGIVYGKALIDAGANMISAGEALCSPAFINPKMYRKYIVSRQKKLCDELTKYGADGVLIHICGDISPIVKDAASTGTVCLDLDWQMNMADTRDKGNVAVRGNLDPSRVLLEGDEELVLEKAKDVLQGKEGGGIILGSGCDVAPDTPLDNLFALVKARELYGKY